MKGRKLFILKNRIGTFYVIEKDVTAAIDLLEDKLNKANYGFSDYRKVTEISVVAKEVVEFADKPNFKTGIINYPFCDLLIPEVNQ